MNFFIAILFTIMSARRTLRLEPGFTFDDFLRMAEEDDPETPTLNCHDLRVSMLPPEGDRTPEDSGEEDNVTLNNLPGAQLRGEVLVEGVLPHCSDDSSDDDLPLSSLAKPSPKKVYNWTEDDFCENSGAWRQSEGNSNSNVDVVSETSPEKIFSEFFDEDLFELLTRESNRYATGKNFLGDIALDEMRVFFGILLLSGYHDLPRRRLYWETSEDVTNPAVSKALSRNRFDFIISNLHACDNNTFDKSDRFGKIRPMIDHLNKKFQKHSPTSEFHSVDESMVPYFGKHGCKQFIHGKPIRYGFKFWLGTTASGYVVFLEPYQGAKSIIKAEYKSFGLGPSVVLQYADVLQSIGNYPYHIFADNFFSTIPLAEELLIRGLKYTGTIRENRCSGCPIPSKAAMKKKSRGDYVQRTCLDGQISLTKWHDNSVVSVVSNALGATPVKSVERFSRKDRTRINVTQPASIALYNKGMGGVDRADQNVSLYRVSIRGKKWYFPLVAYMLDLAEQNSWQLHRERGGKLDHLTFRRQLALYFLNAYGNRARKLGRPSALENYGKRQPLTHVIEKIPKRKRCRGCHKLASTQCADCGVTLHMDCFKMYHNQ